VVTLAVGHWGDDLDGALDHMLHRGQRRLDHWFELSKGLGGLHPIVAHPFEACGNDVLNHPANKRIDIDGFTLDSFAAVRAIMIGDAVAIIAIDAPD
jgi:hypothetical protein